jgi:uncharacterized protein (TIGR02118 family)
MMIKLTALYGHPTDPDAFETYYAKTHMPLVAKMPGLGRHEKALVVGAPGGETPPYHRMFEAWFDDQAGLDATFGSPEGKVVVDDLANFATGGVTIVISEVE